MIQIIGIGAAGNKVLDYIKKQRFTNFIESQFVSISDHEEFKLLNLDDTELVITISGLAGEKSSKYTRLVTKETMLEQVPIKNIIILPFSFEGKSKGVNGALERLVKINPNVQIFSNDDVTNDVTQEMTQNEMMRAYDKEIFETIDKSKQSEWNNYFFEKREGPKLFQVVATYSIKDLKLTLLNPSFKTIDSMTMADNATTTFGLQKKDKSITNIRDVKELTKTMLDEYILKIT